MWRPEPWTNDAVDKIIIHCSDSQGGDAEAIRGWHIARGWADIGYHYVITNGRRGPGGKTYDQADDGIVEVGRSLSIDGAHVRGHNKRSVGICLIGTGAGLFTPQQTLACIRLLADLQVRFAIGRDQVFGHRDLDGGKTCPGFNVYDFVAMIERATP